MFQSDEEIERAVMETEAREWEFYENQRLEKQAIVEMYNSGYRAGEENERERIIKLLEEEYAWFTSIEAGKLYNPIPEIVALIKGEYKS